jgi:hypothetical protein
MTEESVEIVRQPLHVTQRPTRTLDQRLYLRFPSLVHAAARLAAKLSPRSRLRRAAMARTITLAAQAYNRLDLEAVTIGWRADVEYVSAPNAVEAGLLKPIYRGHAGYRAYVAENAEVWGTETRFEPSEIIDMGEQVVVLAEAPMRAQASGVPITIEFAYVGTFDDAGLLCRQQEFHSHAEALEAAGLPV